MNPVQCSFGIGDLVDGKYTVQAHLGSGTFGDVYKVTDAAGGVYAMKLLRLWTVSPAECATLKSRFRMEFDTGRIASNNLAHSYSFGEVQGNPYILMEFCARGDLKSYSLSHEHEIDYAVLAREILSGLNDLHSNGKVHRDLKPENVLLRANGTAVLTDFGIAGDRNKRNTERAIPGQPRQLFGTYPYMPPEQVNPPRGSQATVLPTTDIYSFGVMMYELLTGQLPFGPMSQETLYDYLQNSSQGRWRRDLLMSNKYGKDWCEVIDGCLQPDFKNRLQSASMVLSMLPGLQSRTFSADGRQNWMRVKKGLLLRIMQGEDYGTVFKLDSLLRGGRLMLTMGRMDVNCHVDIAIKETQSYYISRRHCTLEKDPSTGGWIIRDGQWRSDTQEWKLSMNGTYVNSKEADIYGIPFGPGDIISIGDVKLRVEGY